MNSISLEWDRAAQRSLLAARVVVLAAFLDLSMQFPIVAPYAASLGASAAMVGVIVGMYSAANLVGNLLAGVVLDLAGRRVPILCGLAVTVVAVLSYAVAQTPSQLLLARAVHGLAVALLAPGAFAIMGDVTATGRQARVMGRSGAIIAAAMIVGPPLAGVIRDRVGFGAVFGTVALVMGMALAAFWWWGYETTKSPSAARSPMPWSGASLLALALRPRLAATYLVAVALTVGLGTLVTHLPLVVEAMGASGARAGMAFAVFALVAMAVMVSPLTRLSDQYGRRGHLAAGLAIIAGGLAVLGFWGAMGGIVLGMALFGLGFGLLFPSATALVAEGSEQSERGTAFGIFYALYSLGVVIGAWLSGAITEWQGLVTGLPFQTAALAALLAVPAAWLLVPRR